MNKADYYTVLGLTRACTPQDVRQSYRRLALKWHPDKCLDKSEAQLKFSEIQEAYTILNDPSKKKTYDDFGHQGLIDDGSVGGFNPNKFFQKGFKGVEKSAFDILHDILKEKEDDYFFQSYEGFGISDNFKSSVKTFIEDNIFQTEDVNSASFFDTYKPTFMNPNFFMESSSLFSTEADKNTTSSFSFESTDEEDKACVNKSTTVHNECSNNKVDNQTSGSSEKPKVQRASYILINQDTQDDPLFTYARDAEFYAAFELSKEMMKEEAKSNINTSSKKITKDKEGLNIRLMKKKPSKKNRN